MAALLLDCACTRLGDTCPTRACVVPGVEVAIENCCAGDRGGQLTVNIIRHYPSTQFPTPDIGTFANCDTPYVIVEYGVQIARCTPVGSGNRPPSCDALDSAAQLQMADMQLIRDGIACCLRSPSDEMVDAAGRGFRWSLGTHEAIGPEGGCTGSNLQVVIGMMNCLEC